MSPTSAESIPVILDCDPGHDDAVAMIVAARHTRLLGVTTVAGNAPLVDTTRNALVIADLLGIDVPIHAGAARPIVAEARHAPHVHGDNGLTGANLPEPSRAPTSDDAVGFIIDTCHAQDGVWLIGVGPLTNIALALRAAPDLANRIAGISVMGGGTYGNRTPVAEFNIWADPEAAAVVFSYGGQLLMCGLDLTFQLQATPDRIRAVRAIGTRLAELLADLLDFFAIGYTQRYRGVSGPPVHDPCAVLALTHPELFSSRSTYVAVETHGELTRGMTVIDQRDLLIDRPEPTCTVLTEIDATAGFDIILEAVASS